MTKFAYIGRFQEDLTPGLTNLRADLTLRLLNNYLPQFNANNILRTFVQNRYWAGTTVKDTSMPVHDTQLCISFMTVI